MHPVIEGILRASLDRSPRLSEPLEGRRDLPRSAMAKRSLGILPVIAEIKPRVLGRQLLPWEVERIARAYESCGACAISVLTEPTYFLGSAENLAIARRSTGLPVLRKDFIITERQLEEVRSDLVLLIAALGADIGGLVDRALSLGMEPLVEVHTEDEMRRALESDARIIGINNRDLETLQVDLGTFKRLAPMARGRDVFLVAESGVLSRADALSMFQAGADAILVGTALMQSPQALLEISR